MVRSDHHVSTRLVRPDGSVATLGGLDVTETVHNPFNGPVEIPHLSRLSPDGRWLATYDLRSSRVRLLDARHSQRLIADVTIEGTSGQLTAFRWLGDGSGFAIATNRGLWLARLNPMSAARLPASVTAVEVKNAAQQPIPAIDTRMVEDGFIAQAHGTVYFVRPTAKPQVFDLKPAGARVLRANVRTDHRIVAHVRYDARPNEARVPDELWTLDTSGAGAPHRTGRRSCNDGGTVCDVFNWTQGAQFLGYALANGRIVLEDPAHPADPQYEKVVYVDLQHRWDRVHTLWASPIDHRVVAATGRKLQVWDAQGQPMYAFTVPVGSAIRTASFVPGKNDLVVTLNDALVRLDAKGRQVSRIALADKACGRLVCAHADAPGASHFADDGFALPDGSVAVQVVMVSSEHIPGSRGEGRVRPLPKKIVPQRKAQARQQTAW